jgi:sugar lactone lactonase YvrE
VSGIPFGTYRVVANARGDIFYTTPNSVATDYADMKLMELPVGSTTPITLLYDLNSPRAVDIDQYQNLYVNDQGGGRVILVPFVQGSYPQNVDAFTIAGNSKATPATPAVTCSVLPSPTQAAPTSDCSLPTLGVLTGYYSQTVDTAMDAAGNYYFVDANDNVSAGKYNRIVKYSATGVISIVVDGLASAYTAELASDAAGNLYYVSSVSGLLSIPAGSSTATVMNASTLSKPTGVTIDAAGNLIVSDSGNNRLVVMPFENGAVNFANQYLLAPVYTPNGVGIDGFGTMYYATSNASSASILAEQTSVYHAGPLAVGASSTSALVYFAFNATTKVGGFSVSGNGAAVSTTGNTCPSSTATAITYTAGQSCSYNASIRPTRVGAVTAYIGLNDGAGNVVAQFTETAIGTGSAENIDPGTVAAIGSGFTTPEGVAVDRAGNVFVADTGASKVWELVGGAGTPVAVGTGLNKPTSVSVDLAGNLFIADTGNQRVVEVPLVNGQLSTAAQLLVASNLLAPIVIANGPLGSLYVASSGVLSRYEARGLLPPALAYTVSAVKIALPSSIAVDNSGNVFVGDASAGLVAEFTAAQTLYTTDTTAYPQINVITGLTNPTGLATDTAGNLYVVDNGTALVVRVPNTNGTLSSAGAFSVGTFGSPYGIAVDSAGNLIVSDVTTASPSVNRVTRTTGALNFPYQNLNTTSAPLTSQIVSAGTSALTLGAPLYTATGDTARFSLASSTCAAGQVLASAGTCNLTATFTPVAKATSTELLAINAAPTVATTPFNLTLNGLGTLQVATTLAITKPSGNISYGQAVTLTAVLSPSSFNVANATGTVTFTINGQVQKPITISGNMASITTTSLSGGDNSISAVYSGDVNYSPSTAPAVVVTLGLASTTTTLAISTVNSNPTNQLTGNKVTLTATITASVAGALNGNVNFISGGTILGSAQPGLVSGSTTVYMARLETTTIPNGTYSVYAEYVGNSNYTKSDSAAQQLIISGPAVYLVSNTYNVTATASVPGVANLTVASLGGLTGPTYLSCSGLPANATCQFAPGYITNLTPNVSNPVTLQFVVDHTDGTPLPPIASLRSRSEVVFACLLGVPALLLMRRRKRMTGALTLTAVLLLLPLVATVSGCSSGANAAVVTPSGTYPITVTAGVSTSSIKTSTSITINLTVK